MTRTPWNRIALLAANTVMITALIIQGIAMGAWWPFSIAALAAVLMTPLTVKLAQQYGHAWFYNAEDLQPELAGWRHPVWFGSDDWPGEDTENSQGTYWRSTVAIRIPGSRYLIIAIPIRREHTR